MSLEAMLWVMNRAPVQNPSEMVVLYALANNADHRGRRAWPSNRTIAERSLCSPRTVIRHLKALEQRGVIRRGDQSAVRDIRPDRRPVVWDLNLSLCRDEPPDNPPDHGVSPVAERGVNCGSTGGQIVTPLDHGVSPVAERGVNGGRSGVTNGAERGDTAVSHKPYLTVHETVPEPSCPIPSDESERTALALPDEPPLLDAEIVTDTPAPKRTTYPPAFEDWWTTYPRHRNASKKKAHESWRKATRLIDADELQRLTAAYAHNPGVTDVRYCPHPTTWLNEQRWESIDAEDQDTPVLSQQDDRRTRLAAFATAYDNHGEEPRHGQPELGGNRRPDPRLLPDPRQLPQGY